MPRCNNNSYIGVDGSIKGMLNLVTVEVSMAGLIQYDPRGGLALRLRIKSV
jgi:hypothetical protein